MQFIKPAVLLFLAPLSLYSQAELIPLNDFDLSKEIGQGVIDVTEIPLGAGTNGADTDKSFTRITVGLDVDINANIGKLVLGEGNRPDGIDNSGGTATADIDFSNISLGTVNPDGSLSDFSIADPYFEFARNTQGDLIGFRLGFGEANGTFGVEMKTLSGDIESVGQLGGFIPVTATSNVARSNTVNALNILPIGIGGFRHLEFENTKNMYLGFQSQAINYPKIGDGPQGTAQPGFWLNLQDGVNVPDLNFNILNPSNTKPINLFN